MILNHSVFFTYTQLPNFFLKKRFDLSAIELEFLYTFIITCSRKKHSFLLCTFLWTYKVH